MRIDHAILHVMTPTGQIIELGKRRKNQDQGQETSLATIISIAETLALVHDLELKLIQFTVPFLDKEPGSVLPNDLQVIIHKPGTASFKSHRGMSSLIYSRDMIPDTAASLLELVSSYYEGCQQRIREGLIAEKDSLVIEEELASLFSARLFGRLPAIRGSPESGLKNQAEELERPEYFNISYELMGFISFDEITAVDTGSCRTHEFDAGIFAECPFCGSAETRQKPPRIIFDSLNFACKPGLLKPSDVLKFVVPWPKLGEQIVTALVGRQLWNAGAIKTVLFPAKVLWKKQDNSYVATLWQVTKDHLNVAVLAGTEQDTDSTSLKIQLHDLAKEKWEFTEVCERYGLEVLVKNVMIQTRPDRGNLSRIDAVLINHLDG